jgi:hypothetical protein
MTQATPRWGVGNMPRRLAAWVARLQRLLSDRMFAEGDAFAREQGWQITTSTGRFGFGARIYRDPRFGQRAAARRGEESTGWRSDARSG